MTLLILNLEKVYILIEAMQSTSKKTPMIINAPSPLKRSYSCSLNPNLIIGVEKEKSLRPLRPSSSMMISKKLSSARNISFGDVDEGSQKKKIPKRSYSDPLFSTLNRKKTPSRMKGSPVIINGRFFVASNMDYSNDKSYKDSPLPGSTKLDTSILQRKGSEQNKTHNSILLSLDGDRKCTQREIKEFSTDRSPRTGYMYSKSRTQVQEGNFMRIDGPLSLFRKTVEPQANNLQNDIINSEASRGRLVGNVALKLGKKRRKFSSLSKASIKLKKSPQKREFVACIQTEVQRLIDKKDELELRDEDITLQTEKLEAEYINRLKEFSKNSGICRMLNSRKIIAKKYSEDIKRYKDDIRHLQIKLKVHEQSKRESEIILHLNNESKMREVAEKALISKILYNTRKDPQFKELSSRIEDLQNRIKKGKRS